MPLRLAAATLFAVSCSPASEAPVHGTGGSVSNTGGTGSTTGGISGTTGGTFSNTGGTTSFTGGTSTATGGTKATGGTTTATGGTTTTTGGTTTATGGTTTATGGTTTATGGTTTATGGSGGSVSGCATYDGTTAAASKIFTDGFGKSTTGTWQGYAYTYTYGTGAVIKPGSSTSMSCFKAAQMCANGSVPALDSAGVGVGWNISQMMGGTAMAAPITTAVTITVAGAKAGMRVALGPTSGDDFCHTLTAAEATMIGTGLTLKASDFAQYCYDTAKAVPYSTEMIKSIQVAVPGSTTGGAQTFDFCLVDIEPG